ncbi:MAG: OmpA family protein [Deltaproteobacteria bacterium]|nr:OmpA family protein [Deltaproteobacteria bacterium]
MTRPILAALAGAALLAACASSDTRTATAQPEEAEPAGGPIAWTVTDVWVAPDISSTCVAAPVPRAYFEFDSAKLSEESKSRMDNLAGCLSAGPLVGRAIEVVGYTDPSGTADYNHDLARERAETVANELEREGVPPRCVEVVSHGEAGREALPESAYPIARRVDVRLDPDRSTCRPL